MNEKINAALLDLQQSLGDIHNWAQLIRNSENAAAEAIESAAAVIDKTERLLGQVSKDSNETWVVVQKSATEIQTSVQALLEGHQELVQAASQLTEYLRSVNFPSRLDKVDATLASISPGVQNLSDKMDRYRDQLSLKAETEHQQTRNIALALQEQQNRLQRRQNLYFGIQVTLSLVLIGLLVFFMIR